MRANRSKLEKALTVIAAFERFGKPYDFNFDFVTDESLVCTELVYKSWRPSAERDGLELSLVDVMGRQTLPANELVRQFDAQYDQPNRSMEFVFFVDGLERQKSSKTSTIEDFRATWRRPKWDVLQE